jgi:hypothetical protein
MADKKVSFQFTPDDVEAIEKIKAKMSETQGKVTMIAAIRMAIRTAAKA